MSKQQVIVVAVLNTLILAGLFTMFGLHRLSWDQLLVALGLLGTPSALGMLFGKRQSDQSPPPPPGGTP